MNVIDDHHPTLLARIIHFLGPRGLFTWILTFVLMAIIASSMTNNIQGLQVSFVIPVVFLALTMGWLFSQLPIKSFPGAVMGLIFGIEYLLISVGRLEDSIWTIAKAIILFFEQLVTWYWTEIPPQWYVVPRLYNNLFMDMGTLITRAGYWLRDVIFGIGALDPVGSTLIWGFGFWVSAFWAGWVGKRSHNPLLGILPIGILMGFVFSYTGVNPYNILPILGLTLVLMALMTHYARESQWSVSGVDFSQGLWGDVSVLSTVMAIMLVVMAAIVPSISFDKISDWFREVTTTEGNRTEVVADSLGLEARTEPRAPTPIELVAQTGLPRQHLIGSGPELSRIVVMVIQTGDLPSLPDDTGVSVEVPRYYWRSITYDRYISRGWMTSNTDEAEYEAGEIVISPESDNTRLVRQHVQVISDSLGDLVYVTGNLVTMDEDFKVAMRPPGEVFAVTSEALDFRADSLLPVYTEEQLKAVSTNYPTWIADRYLQLPESTTDRVLELARELTATAPTPYDRAVAIEQYLRTFEYTLDVPTPGVGQDIADYFLFELQKGYCDYYATSMVVLARAAGLPARLVVGYVSGSYDYFNARYVITEAEAHAWVEVYFPEVGWIEFEPTGGRPPIERLTEEDPYIWPEDFTLEPLVDKNTSRFSRIVLWQWGLVIGFTAVAFTLLVTIGDTLFLFVYKTPAWMMALLYRRLCHQARQLEAFIHDGDTPNEVLEALAKRIATIVSERDVAGEYITASVELARTLVDDYIKLWYSPRNAMTRIQRWEIAWLWWNLRWHLWLAWLLRRPRKERAPMPTTVPPSIPPDRYMQRPPPSM